MVQGGPLDVLLGLRGPQHLVIVGGLMVSCMPVFPSGKGVMSAFGAPVQWLVVHGI
jgi:hypothetical protein